MPGFKKKNHNGQMRTANSENLQHTGIISPQSNKLMHLKEIYCQATDKYPLNFLSGSKC